MKYRCTIGDKEVQYKTDSVVTSNMHTDTPPKVGIMKHFVLLPNLNSFVTLKVFKTTNEDKNSGLLNIDMSSEHFEKSVWPKNISGPCVIT